MIFILNCPWNDKIHDFSVCLRTSSNQADTKRFRKHTGKYLKFQITFLCYYQLFKYRKVNIISMSIFFLQKNVLVVTYISFSFLKIYSKQKQKQDKSNVYWTIPVSLPGTFPNIFRMGPLLLINESRSLWGQHICQEVAKGGHLEGATS